MSRIGRMPIHIPSGVEVTLNGSDITVKGPKGTLNKSLHKDMKIEVADNTITVLRPSDDKEHRALHGLTRALINNMVIGVTQGYTKTLDVNGVGYRVAKNGNQLVMNLGLSHQIIIDEPKDIKIEVPAVNKIIVSGADKQMVGQFAAEIRQKRPPEPYQGKGIKYAEEVIIRKEGKAGKSTGSKK